MARDPAEFAAPLRQLARLDPVELGQQAVLERIVQAAATCCGSTGGVGLLLLNRDQQLCYVAAAGRPRRSLAGSWCDSAKARRWTRGSPRRGSRRAASDRRRGQHNR